MTDRRKCEQLASPTFAHTNNLHWPFYFYVIPSNITEIDLAKGYRVYCYGYIVILKKLFWIKHWENVSNLFCSIIMKFFHYERGSTLEKLFEFERKTIRIRTGIECIISNFQLDASPKTYNYVNICMVILYKNGSCYHRFSSAFYAQILFMSKVLQLFH